MYKLRSYTVVYHTCNENTLIFEEYDSLKGTIELLSEAFTKSILKVEGDKLVLLIIDAIR